MDNWYNTESEWYAPLSCNRTQPAEAPAEPALPDAAGSGSAKKRSSRWRVLGGIFLALAVVAGSSLLFGGKEKPASVINDHEPAGSAGEGSGDENFFTFPENEDGEDSGEEEMPDDYNDFFDGYYTSVQTDVAVIDIPVYSGKSSFHLELAEPQDAELSLAELYDRCADSIVAIAAYSGDDTAYSWATGVIISSDGIIATNTHVVDGTDRAVVTLSDDRTFEAELIGADFISDICVLKIDADNLPAAEFGDSAYLKVGQPVAAIGNPLGETFRSTLTNGIISAIERGIRYNGRSMTLIQTNTAINEGNSGGALFNMYGQVIGITNMKMMSSYSSIEGIGFAIPSASARTVINGIIENGEYRGRTSIGITVGQIPEAASTLYEIPGGLYITDVEEKSDAFAKGIVKGDILIAVNGITVTTTDEVGAIKNEYSVGDVLTLTIWRAGETMDIDVVLVDTLDLYK